MIAGVNKSKTLRKYIDHANVNVNLTVENTI